MPYIKQPDNIGCCGQCCIGTVLCISLEDAVNLVGHNHGTRTIELVKFLRSDGSKLKRGFPTEYSLCKVAFKEVKQTHWILWQDNKVYDSNYGTVLTFDDWNNISNNFSRTPRITSFLEIDKEYIIKNKLTK